MRKLLISILIVVFVAVVASCSKEDASVPSYRTDLLSVKTDKDSILTDLILDNGASYKMSSQKIKGTAPNATLRCLVSFSKDETDTTKALVYSAKLVKSDLPIPTDSVKKHTMSPVDITSVWQSGGYANFCFSPVINGGEKYKYTFCVDSLRNRNLYVSFLFVRPDTTIEAYHAALYYSLPLQKSRYKEDFDSLRVSINTYDGMKHYSFARINDK